jgi:hypothetical protein
MTNTNNIDSNLTKDSTFIDVCLPTKRIDEEIEIMIESFGVQFPSKYESYSDANFIRGMEDFVQRVAANACRNLIAANKSGKRNDLA